MPEVLLQAQDINLRTKRSPPAQPATRRLLKSNTTQSKSLIATSLLYFLPRTTRHNLTGKGMTWERNIARLFFMQTTNKRRRQRSLLKSWSLQVPTAGISLQK